MATLYVKTPNGTTKTVDLENMNITFSHKTRWYPGAGTGEANEWTRLPSGLIIQILRGWNGFPANTNIITYPIAFTDQLHAWSFCGMSAVDPTSTTTTLTLASINTWTAYTPNLSRMYVNPVYLTVDSSISNTPTMSRVNTVWGTFLIIGY